MLVSLKSPRTPEGHVFSLKGSLSRATGEPIVYMHLGNEAGFLLVHGQRSARLWTKTCGWIKEPTCLRSVGPFFSRLSSFLSSFPRLGLIIWIIYISLLTYSPLCVCLFLLRRSHLVLPPPLGALMKAGRVNVCQRTNRRGR